MVYLRRAFLRLICPVSGKKVWKNLAHDLLRAIAVVPLYNHDLLRYLDTLLNRAEPEYTTGSGVGLLVTVRNTHASTSGHVEASEIALLIDNGDEAHVVGKDIDIVVWWDCDCNLVLHWGSVLQALCFLTAEHTLRGR